MTACEILMIIISWNALLSHATFITRPNIFGGKDRLLKTTVKLSSQISACTCTGAAAIRRPATLPPSTRPSGPDKHTLRPPVLLLWPPFSDGRYEPESARISNLPWIEKEQIFLKRNNEWRLWSEVDRTTISKDRIASSAQLKHSVHGNI